MRLNFDRAVFFRDTYQSIVLIAFGLAEIGNFYPSQYKLDSYFKGTLIVQRKKIQLFSFDIHSIKQEEVFKFDQ